jgi:hypothetical protein
LKSAGVAERPLDGCNLSISSFVGSSSGDFRRLLLAQAVAAELQAMRIMDDAVEDGVAGRGQRRPAAAARSSVSPMVLRARFSDRAICRSLAPPSFFRRRISRTRRIDTLSAGIGPPLVVPDEQRRRTPPSGRALATPFRGGRLQIGMAEIKSESLADFIPESPADFPRNMQPSRVMPPPWRPAAEKSRTEAGRYRVPEKMSVAIKFDRGGRKGPFFLAVRG